MTTTRRKFLRDMGLGLGATTVLVAAPGMAVAEEAAPGNPQTSTDFADTSYAAVDFRYSPLSFQTAVCFPDDHHKSLVGNHGEMRYGHPGLGFDIDYFPEVVEFSLEGMETNEVKSQKLNDPNVPIVYTRIDRPAAFLELTAFATNRADEGRVDNVILEVAPRTRHALHAVPLVTIRTKREIKLQKGDGHTILRLGQDQAPPFMVVDAPLTPGRNGVIFQSFTLKVGFAATDLPFRFFFRFPQDGQSYDKLAEGLSHPDQLLAEARDYWQNWKPFGRPVSWQLPGSHGKFLAACARNIQQAREERDGHLTFQVGPTVYRGLWFADGNFILEAARYLGYDAAAQQGLETEWTRQQPDGSLVAGAGREHWKDTGIAMFTLVRQAELSQDWSTFRKMQPQVLHAIQFLKNLCDEARKGDSINGKYGLLPPGFGDGGLGGIRPEFTNTIWALAGLKAVTQAARRIHLAGFESAEEFYRQLRASFFAAALQEMRRHPDGFEYLPMLMKEDPAWSAPDPWDRPRPQAAQWALSQAIYPGLVFEKNDPIVQGHIRLMQACSQEDIPAETGWLPHGGVWNYNAAFVAHVYLWAGVKDWAVRTFTGFLNHASPLYCWREEQPLRGSLTAGYIGDMPHNWASAECILYLRHLLALEDGDDLRLVDGIGEAELAAHDPLKLAESPTRFGRISMDLEPSNHDTGWRLKFQRASGPVPASIRVPAKLGSRFQFSQITGAQARREGNVILVTPTATSWEVVWKS